MRRGRIKVVIDLLHIFAVVALAVGQAEQALLENGIAAIPQSDSKAQLLLVIAETGNAVLAPAVGAAASCVVRQILPGIAVGAVILAHRAPLALAQVRAPAFPAAFLPRIFGEA